jgi:hypothetical protein
MSGHHPSFFEKKMDGAKGSSQGKKEASNPFVLPAITPNLYAHLMLRVMEVLYEYYQIFHIDILGEI